MDTFDRETASMYAAWFRPLSDPTRLLVLNLLASHDEPMTVGEIVDALDVGQPTVSEHLRVLSEARFVQVRPVGTRRYYGINQRCLEKFPTAAAVIMGQVERVAPPRAVEPPWSEVLGRRMTTETVSIGPYGPADRADVERLLLGSGLPIEGLDPAPDRTLVARVEDRVVGTATIHLYEDAALLRSVAVAFGRRGAGLGAWLTEEALSMARVSGARAIYLLTETASSFFERLGFGRVTRDEVPVDVSSDVEFTSLCPSSAVVMALRLSDPC